MAEEKKNERRPFSLEPYNADTKEETNRDNDNPKFGWKIFLEHPYELEIIDILSLKKVTKTYFEKEEEDNMIPIWGIKMFFHDRLGDTEETFEFFNEKSRDDFYLILKNKLRSKGVMIL